MEFTIFIVMAILFWGLAPIFGKLGLKKLDPIAALTIRTFVIAVIMMVICAATGRFSGLVKADAKDILLISAEGVFASILGHFAYYYALKLGDASRVAPIIAAYPAVTVFAAVLVLGEKFSWNKVFGLTAILLGIVLMKK